MACNLVYIFCLCLYAIIFHICLGRSFADAVRSPAAGKLACVNIKIVGITKVCFFCSIRFPKLSAPILCVYIYMIKCKII